MQAKDLDQKLKILIEFQSLLFSSESTQIDIKSFIEKHYNDLSQAEIDHQLVLAMSLNYKKISDLAPLLSKSEIPSIDILHFDQTLIFLLLQAKIQFPIEFFLSQFRFRGDFTYDYLDNYTVKTILYLEKGLFEELSKENQLDQLKGKLLQFEIREESKLEEAIETDNLDSFRILISDDNFDQTIKKQNLCFHYSEIPILSFCIEKQALKCFKHALINGADPFQRTVFNSQ